MLTSFDGLLGLVLAWTCLQMIFGMSMTGITYDLNFCMHVLVRVLMGINKVMAQIPDDETIHQFMDAV